MTIQTLTIADVLAMLDHPEQATFDWKRDFALPKNDESRGEFVKDLAAIANAIRKSYGFILYGVDPSNKASPVVGISQSYDDASLQQLVKGKITPLPSFLYYEVSAGPRKVGVVQVNPSTNRPHTIQVDLGKVRRGQILIRRGSSTDAATERDLLDFFYGPDSTYFPAVRQQLGINVQDTRAKTAYLAQLMKMAEKADDDMNEVLGFPPKNRR